ncbi:DUF1801 domain-containing protein [Actinomyces sp.]|uniref:DUF1801 domain-containing protein n=1 Tax=Actinomyces sp. TaxID=29317 RepID=UPI002896555F|nr:DUF1801 domain-containing protein [Actinomyces sp.]
MAQNKTRPTDVPIEEFLATATPRRREESRVLIDLMRDVTGEPPVMWGPSIIGFGSYHYRYDSGREGDAGLAGFSPRKARLTIYLPDGCARHSDALGALGPHSSTVSCVYVTRLSDIDLDVLKGIVTDSVAHMRELSDQQQAEGKS